MSQKSAEYRFRLPVIRSVLSQGEPSLATCPIFSRQQFYEIRRNFQTYGADGLIDRLPGPRNPHPNRVPEAVEQAILEHALAHPCHGPMRVAQELVLRGIQVSSGGVRGVWQRHGLLTKHDRLLRLEKTTAEQQISLTDEQVKLLERFSPEFRERHIEAPHTGALVAVDTFFVGVLKGVGKVYLQTAIDCASRYARAELAKVPPAQQVESQRRGASMPTSCRSPRCSCSTTTCYPPSSVSGALRPFFREAGRMCLQAVVTASS